MYSEPGKGTTFKIYFPMVTEDVDQIKKETFSSGVLHGTEIILIAEDDAMVREMAHDTLKKYGYTVLKASSGKEALQICREYKGDIHLLLTDVVMPGMSGKVLADEIKPLHPDIKVLFMSGYTDNAIVHRGMLDEGIRFIQKPFSPHDLVCKVRQILDAKI